jgi:PAS domain S-box-containing protein
VELLGARRCAFRQQVELQMGKKSPHSEPTPSATPRASGSGVRWLTQRARTDSGAGNFNARAIALTAERCAIVTDSDNRIVCWNRASEDLFGLTSEQVAGRNLQQSVDVRDVFGNRLCSGHSALHEMVRGGEAPVSFELDVRTASGQRLRVAVSIVVVLGPDPGRYELVYMLTPLRRRRRADEAIDRILAERPEFAPPESSDGGDVRPKLSPRQHQVLQLIASGLTAREIADELSISVHTVRSHIRNILRELDVSKQVEAVALAVRERLI